MLSFKRDGEPIQALHLFFLESKKVIHEGVVLRLPASRGDVPLDVPTT